jgi:beta-glucosidase
MPWKNKVAAIIEAWYPGEGGGRAIANILFGKVNPSGKLPVTFPARNEDIPTWGQNGTIAKDPVYAERLNIGYRWYDAKNIKPMFEFGYGLSYTHFAYSGLSVKTEPDNTMMVAFTAKNDGQVAGAESQFPFLHASRASGVWMPTTGNSFRAAECTWAHPRGTSALRINNDKW